MRIGADVSVTRKMFAYARHAGRFQSEMQRLGQQRTSLGITMKGAIADHPAFAIVEVKNRRKTEVQAVRSKFGAHDESQVAGKRARALRLSLPDSAQGAHGRNLRKALYETLHAAALVVNRNEKRR